MMQETEQAIQSIADSLKIMATQASVETKSPQEDLIEKYHSLEQINARLAAQIMKKDRELTDVTGKYNDLYVKQDKLERSRKALLDGVKHITIEYGGGAGAYASMLLMRAEIV